MIGVSVMLFPTAAASADSIAPGTKVMHTVVSAGVPATVITKPSSSLIKFASR